MAIKKDNITDSWLCVDCGLNTAPRTPDGPTMRAQIALTGESDFYFTVFDEVYMVRRIVWKKAGMGPFSGCLCIGCLEKRLGRNLTPEDFDWNSPLNNLEFPCTYRLRDRRGAGYNSVGQRKV
jgi:hypothetical protein